MRPSDEAQERAVETLARLSEIPGLEGGIAAFFGSELQLVRWYEPEGHNHVWVACRPEGVVVTTTRPVGENVVPGRIMAVVFAGDQITYSIAVGAQEIRVKSDPFCSFQDGDQVFVQLPRERCLLISRDDDCQKELADARSQR